MLTLKNNEFDSYQFLGSGTTRNSGQYLSNNRCGLKNAFRNMVWSSSGGGASQQRCYLGGFAANQGQAECWTKDRGGGSCSGAPQLDRFGDDVYSNYRATRELGGARAAVAAATAADNPQGGREGAGRQGGRTEHARAARPDESGRVWRSEPGMNIMGHPHTAEPAVFPTCDKV